MPIIHLQRRMREIGRIRIGQQVPIANPKGKATTRPVKLDTFRLTSTDQRVIQAAAQLYGGDAHPWADQPGQWEVVTETAELPILVPPGGLALTQWYELWTGGGCVRRCDGETEFIGDQGCQCDPEHRECAIHTRLSVVLSDIQGLGVWRLDTQGWYAATEIGHVVPLLEGAAERGRFLPARLRLEQRRVLRAGKTMRFAVPVIDIDITIGQMRSLVSGPTPEPVSLANPDTGEIRAIEATTGLTPPTNPFDGPTVAEQVTAAHTPPSRSRADTPQLPSTGRRPRPVSEAAAAPADKPIQVGGVAVAERDPNLITVPQLRKLHAMFNGRGITSDDEKHQWLSTHTGRSVESCNDVTKEEASFVFDLLKAPDAVVVDGEPF